MNKFVNILLLIVLIPVIGFSLFVGFDLPIELIKMSGANAPYTTEIFYSLALVLLLILLNRSIKRWLGIKMVNQVARFQWNVPLNNDRNKQVILYLILEASVHFFVAFSLYQITSQTLPIVLVLTISGLDHLVLGLLGKYKKLFRIGITSKAILLADREVKAIFFSGLKEVDLQQKSLFFDYREGLQLSIPSDAIPLKDVSDFKHRFESNIKREQVYFSEIFKAF